MNHDFDLRVDPTFALLRPMSLRLAATALAFAASGWPAIVHGQAADEAALRVVAELAQANGQALACRDTAAAQRAKAAMIELAPKTPRFATAFEDGTQRAFLAQTREPQPCPEAAAARVRVETLVLRLRAAVGGLPHAQIADEGELPLHSMPRYLLQGPRGQAVTSDDFRGRFQLLTFGFTSCPDVCPSTLAEMQQVLAALGERAAKLQPVFVTIDPQRDTPVVVEAYTQAFDKRILGLTGSEALVRRAADGFKVRYRKVQEAGAAPDVYTMDHSAGMFLLGPDGQLLERIVYGTPVRDIVTRVERWIDAAVPR
jgi:protein SCO1/2